MTEITLAEQVDAAVSGLAGTFELSSLVTETLDDLASAFDLLAWAEDEIEEAVWRHPEQRDIVWHAFNLIRPPDMGERMSTEMVYRAHAKELLERVAAGEDTRPATAAQLCVLCAEASLIAPMHAAAFGLYLRVWALAFPGNKLTIEQAGQRAHYEELFGQQINEQEAELRRRAADPERVLGEITCRGLHHGERVLCRYALADDLDA